MKNGEKKKVLVVENDEQVVAAFQSSLNCAGFDAHATWSGRDALAALESGHFDLVLTDGYLPDLHVTEFLERISRLRARPAIVVMQKPLPKLSVARRYQKLGAYAVMDKRDPVAVGRAIAACCSGAKSPTLGMTGGPVRLRCRSTRMRAENSGKATVFSK